MIKLFSMFSGFGGAEFALKKAEIDFEVVGYSEIDKYAIQCYEQNHKGKNFGDCTKIDPNELPDFDLLTGGFPCPSFSVAGKGLGEQDPRGRLFQEIIRIAEVKKPGFMLLENVKGLTYKNHKATFQKILSELDRIGYVVKWKVLNSKEHGIPQNRERVWFVCFRNEKELDSFKFPEKEELKIFLKDILEDEVDEKYYLKQEQVDKLLKNGNMNCNPSGKGMNGNVYFGDVSPAITTNKGEGHKIIQINNPKQLNNSKESHNQQPYMQNRIYDSYGISPSICSVQPNILERNKIVQLNSPKHSNDRVYSQEGVSPTLNSMQGGNRQPFIVASRKAQRNIPKSERTFDGQQLEPKNDGTSNTISTVQKDNWLYENSRIRKLTPKECFRLQGFLNDEIKLDGLSNCQRYKLAGNGFDVNLVSKIFNEMFK